MTKIPSFCTNRKANQRLQIASTNEKRRFIKTPRHLVYKRIIFYRYSYVQVSVDVNKAWKTSRRAKLPSKMKLLCFSLLFLIKLKLIVCSKWTDTFTLSTYNIWNIMFNWEIRKFRISQMVPYFSINHHTGIL